jgi:hypothetical protein
MTVRRPGGALYDLDALDLDARERAFLLGLAVEAGGVEAGGVGGTAVALHLSGSLLVLPGDVVRVSAPPGTVLPPDLQTECAWLSRAEGHLAMPGGCGAAAPLAQVRILAPPDPLVRDLQRLGLLMAGAVVMNASAQNAVLLRATFPATFPAT